MSTEIKNFYFRAIQSGRSRMMRKVRATSREEAIEKLEGLFPNARLEYVKEEVIGHMPARRARHRWRSR